MITRKMIKNGLLKGVLTIDVEEPKPNIPRDIVCRVTKSINAPIDFFYITQYDRIEKDLKPFGTIEEYRNNTSFEQMVDHIKTALDDFSLMPRNNIHILYDEIERLLRSI